MTSHDLSRPESDPEPLAWHQELVLPVLLAAGRRVYGRAIRDALHGAGFEDMPRSGSRIVGGMARNQSGIGDVAAELQVTKQAASQLVDTLVLRGYLDRQTDPDDRRRLLVTLTDRGRAAAAAINGAVAGVDRALVDRVGAEQLAAARATIGALVELGNTTT